MMSNFLIHSENKPQSKAFYEPLKVGISQKIVTENVQTGLFQGSANSNGRDLLDHKTSTVATPLKKYSLQANQI